MAAAGTPRVLHGSTTTIDRSGNCWVLIWDGLLGVGLGAILTEKGEVLLSWWLPEG
jgi:hypothetical protein